MTEKLENKLRMYYSVSSVCDTNTDLWQENEAFKASYAKFQSYIPVIQKYRDVLKMENIATDTLKSFDRVELEEMGFYISGKIIQYAKDSNNEKLLSDMREKRNKLLRSEHIELFAICTSISKEALNYIDRLTDYDISTENINEFQQLTNYFSLNINRVRNSTTKHKSAREIIAKYFRDADEILKERLDSDIEFFKNSDPDFYYQYKSARIVVDINDELPSGSQKKNVVNYIH
jgi:hypothetical protein